MWPDASSAGMRASTDAANPGVNWSYMPHHTRREFLGQAVAGTAVLPQPPALDRRPNILFLMTDQMQARVLDPSHPCHTPNLDRLASRGVRFTHAYTPNPVCSPARASLMTGLLPHSHGVVQVTHCTADDQAVLRTGKRHWAQELAAAGYRTGYFGKWHIERTNELGRFGWQVNGETTQPLWKREAARLEANQAAEEPLLRKTLGGPGYTNALFYGAGVARPHATLEVAPRLAASFLDTAARENQPWCCFVSLVEPHDPYLCARRSFERYDPAKIPVPPNWNDGLEGRPGLYRKAARAFAHLTEREKQEAAACYYASITEVDEQFGRLLDRLERAGQLENTIVVMTADHGEFLGAHGLYMKNVSGYEEAHNIPMVVAGPGIARGAVSHARAGLHDLAPTLLELAGLKPIGSPDSRSFAPVLRNPAAESAKYLTGYAENYGTRYWFTQRVIWEGPWKYVWNGFDFDEMYNLEADPYEMRNLAAGAAHRGQARHMMELAWRIVRATGDAPLLGADYPVLRLAECGPGAAR